MKKFVLPENWVVKASNVEEDAVLTEYMNNTFNTNIKPGLMGMQYWCYSNTPMKNYSASDNKHDGSEYNSFPNSTKITYEQFVNYVLNEINNPCEYDPELEIILKRLLE